MLPAGLAVIIFGMAWWDIQEKKQKIELIKQMIEAKKQGLKIKIKFDEEE